MFEDLVTPEGQAFADFIESVICNPYPYDTKDHARYDVAMADLMKGVKS